LHLVKTLREFRYADTRNIDQGGPIRAKARVLTELIEDESKLIKEKENYRRIREQMGKPGIVDLSSDPSNSRFTLDLSQPRTSSDTRSSQQLSRPAYRPSYDGRYSLSLLKAIDEEAVGGS
jgi:hypothetical protein